MGVFGAFFGRKGVVGFSGPVLGVSRGVVGFIVAMFLRPVRDICRPARPDVGASAKEFTLCRSWMQRGARGWLRWGFCSIRSWLSACRRRVVVLMTPFPPFGDGEITVRGCVVPKVQTTSMKNADNRSVVGEVVCVLGAVVSVVVAMLTAGPLCWQHEPFHAQLNPIGGMVGSLPRPPPIGLTCASMGPGVHLPDLGHHLSG